MHPSDVSLCFPKSDQRAPTSRPGRIPLDGFISRRAIVPNPAGSQPPRAPPRYREHELKSVGFASEEQLVKAIVACTRRARRHDYRVEAEVDAGVGIADLVLAKRSSRSTAALRALGSMKPRLAVLLSRTVGDAITTRDALASTIGSSSAAAQRLLTQLTSAGLASGNASDLRLATISTLPFERLIAVEAKVSEWQRVLVQAYRNLQFADESWVVLDHAYIRPAIAQLDRFKVSGVGLASVDRAQGLFIHLAAESTGPMSVGKRWQAQAVLAARAIARRPSPERPQRLVPTGEV